ncbi:Putative enterotoxin [Mycoavidus cysteinexigens]|uniref:Enterotoxin n=1 Tax=Mycoavidus cysteinexigens TaxID=1553431 RepID=A0A2Z6EXQ8_9BURK|nr:ShET2/EspL2 family type III secretion system effector toxin [Mycoavidus cysteinexigens]BBE10226.1 Putative enterotoxin [Mycoavidus cysteinexigens]GAM53411.1 hypothetical protein EBME_1874 [bacterium endosymbiont of Mortierella elongata FMR23-6]GLR00643.1 hypothetical protein GCM10007934_04540 [Mycoavidus cysteinexigens]
MNLKLIEAALSNYCQDEKDEKKTQIKTAIENSLVGKHKLNLKNCDAEAVQSVPKELWGALEGIKSLTLPPKLQKLPDGIQSIESLNRLKIKDAKIEHIDLRNLNVRELKLSGESIKKVSVKPKTRVYYDSKRDEKLPVIFDDSGKDVKGTAMRHFYLSATFKENENTKGILKNNLNLLHKSKENSFEIACRHLAYNEIILEQGHIEEKESGGQLYERKSDNRYFHLSEGGIESEITLEHEIGYNKIVNEATENYVVGHTQWEEFLKDQFPDITPDSPKQMLMVSGNHVMAISLSTKNATHIKPKQYIIEFYDPNDTLTHKRIIMDNFDKLGGMGINDLMQEESIRTYYGNGKEECSLLQLVPKGAFENPMDPMSQIEDKTRKHKIFLSENEKNNPMWAHCLFSSNLSLNQLEEAVDKSPNMETRLKLLEASNGKGESGLYYALRSNNSHNLIENYFNILHVQYKKSNIEQDDIGRLLASRNESEVPALHMGFDAGNIQSVEEFWEVLKKCHEKGMIEPSHIKNILIPTGSNELALLPLIVNGNNDDKIELFAKILNEARDSSYINDQEILEILLDKNEGDISGFEEIYLTGELPGFTSLINKLNLPQEMKSHLHTEMLKFVNNPE